MPLITKTFDYTGQFQIAELPTGTTALTMHLWGGAGGPGGMDTQAAIQDAVLKVFEGMGHNLPQPLWGGIVEAISTHTRAHD